MCTAKKELTDRGNVSSHSNPDRDTNAVARILYRAAFPIAWFCLRLRISANVVSGGSLISAAVAAISLVGWRAPLIFASLWALSVILDFADGTVARMSKQVNQTAFRLDHTLDLLKISISFVAIASYWNAPQLWVTSTLSLSALFIFTILNHDLERAIESTPASTLRRGSRRDSPFRRLMLPFVTLHGGSLLLLTVAAFSVRFAYLTFGYFLLLCTLLALRNARLLRKLPRPNRR